MEDCLDGASNYGLWKPRVILALEEYDMMDLQSKKCLCQKKKNVKLLGKDMM